MNEDDDLAMWGEYTVYLPSSLVSCVMLQYKLSENCVFFLSSSICLSCPFGSRNEFLFAEYYHSHKKPGLMAIAGCTVN